MSILQRSYYGTRTPIYTSAASGIMDTRPTTSLLIRGCALLAEDEPGGLLYNQDILIRGKYIVAVGPSGSLTELQTGPVERVIDGGQRIVIPGLINAHTHSLENLLKASSPSLPLELWLVPLFAAALEWSPRLVYLSTLLGAIEMLKTGTTAVLDHLWTGSGVAGDYLDATMQAYRDAGIRAAVAPSIEDQDLVLQAAAKRGIPMPSHPFTDRFTLWPSIDEQLAILEDFMHTWHNSEDGRLRCFTGPSGIHWCSERLLASCLELTDRYQTGMHLHAVETELQARVIHEFLGRGGISYLDQIGILRPGTSLAHTIWLDDGDLETLALSGTTVVHNPVSNLRLGSGRFPFSTALRQGVEVALGSDGSASNDTQNMFGVLKLTGLMHNQPDSDYNNWPQPTEILRTATRGGAAALGMTGELAEIAPNKLADLVLIDLESAAFLPLHNPYLHLVYCEHGVSVATVIVNGEVVVEDGNVTNVDEKAIRHEIRDRCRSTWQSSPAHLVHSDATSAVLAALDQLRHLILQKEGAGSSFM
jgi:5-methylthioadenosine/S-adenosylhomocysteine deaminase